MTVVNSYVIDDSCMVMLVKYKYLWGREEGEKYKAETHGVIGFW